MSLSWSRQEAEAIANALVSERLAACVNILPGIESVYSWKGEIHCDPEIKLIIKTRQSLTSALIERVNEPPQL